MPKTGATKAVVIYATWDSTTNPKKDTLPDWWARVWDTARQLSVPKFYKDNSLGKYSLQTVPYGKGTVRCFTSAIKPIRPYVQAAFNEDILRQADDSINFANFDANGDHIVDGVFMVIVNYDATAGVGHLFLTNSEFVTHDSVGDQPIKISSYQGTAQFATSEELAITVCSHEWGHILGAGDWYGRDNTCWGMGAFSIMGTGFWNQRAVPFDPYHRILFGWDTAITINTPLFGQNIPNYLTSGSIYKVSVPSDPNNQLSGQFFYATNHKGVNWEIDPRGRWEEFFPTNGLLIWHVGGDRGFCGAKPDNVDLELPHGMYRRDSTCNITIPDSSTRQGRDSLDIKCVFRNDTCIAYCGYDPYGYGVGSATCFWRGQKNFDGKSNPSSDAWWRDAAGVFREQTFSSHLAVRNVSATLFGSATADLLVNNWYGHIAANTTWGPNKVYAITGDLTVDSGKTLTIDSCTTILFQANEDNQKSIPDTSRSAIVVNPGGKLIVKGTRTYPVLFLSSKPEAQASTEDWRGIAVRPGAVFACSNAVIRHAYAGIEDSSKFLHTIQNVHIGRCKMYGILADNADSLTIRGCRVDSVNANPGGGGIAVYSGTTAGAKLIADTAYRCWYGFVVEGSGAPMDSCFVGGDSSGTLISNIGLFNLGQGYIPSPPTLSVTNTNVEGYFSLQHFFNSTEGRVSLSDCDLLAYDGPPRSPVIVRNSNGSILKIRRSSIWHWGQYGVLTGHISSGVPNLGRTNQSDSGNNDFYTSAPGSAWKFVWDLDCGSCTTPIIWAEYNQWYMVPPSSRFSNNVDRYPYLPVPPPKLVAEDGDGGTSNLPKPTALFQNYPNPFNPTTLIQFNLEKAEKVNLEIFNILGQKVRTLLSKEEFAAGPYSFLWDGKDDRGASVSSGLYIYRLATPSYLKTKKMTLVK